jgi:APA family basic amino acid/polyamine antiporter
MLAPSELAGATRVAADALGRAFGPAGGRALAALVVVSSLGVLNGSILTGVRVPYAMAIRGMLFAPLGRLHSRTHSPVNALLAQGFFACLIVVLLDKFENIASLFVDTTWLFYAVSFCGLLWIQWRERDGGGPENAGTGPRSAAVSSVAAGTSIRFPYSTPAAALFIVVTLAIIGSDLVTGDWHVRCGMLVVAAGIPMYHVWRRLTAAPVRG